MPAKKGKTTQEKIAKALEVQRQKFIRCSPMKKDMPPIIEENSNEKAEMETELEEIEEIVEEEPEEEKEEEDLEPKKAKHDYRLKIRGGVQPAPTKPKKTINKGKREHILRSMWNLPSGTTIL